MDLVDVVVYHVFVMNFIIDGRPHHHYHYHQNHLHHH